MNTNGWDTISVLDIKQVNAQLQKRLAELVMKFDTSWTDAFAGQFEAKGNFGPWSITGGSGADIYLTLPIRSGTLSQKNVTGKIIDISGMTVEVEVNLEWIPSSVSAGVTNLQFDLGAITPQGGQRKPGDIFVKNVSDPKKTGFGLDVGNGIANALLSNQDKISFIFAQTGIVNAQTATWLLPKRSTYSYHTPQGGSESYLAILSVTTDRDISQLNSNIDSGIVSSQYPLAFVISGDLFLQNAILPVLPGTFPHSNAGNFSYANGKISLVRSFDLDSIREGAIDYTPTIESLTIEIDANALNSSASGSCGLHLPHAYLSFSAVTNNVLVYNTTNQTFSFQKDPNPVSNSHNHVPWYDYLIGLGALGAAIIAIVLAAVESGLGDSLSGSKLAGSLSAAPASTVKWVGLDQVRIQNGELNDCLLFHSDVA
ncbi:TULIP family P47-like protein [Paraburkholderia atlantica]|uniref:TULIP family P47-like protein n=1 Tax=Paraburkholderia atlantica TaxID=2654982 RepID=UPI0016155A61|nr:TULIP family P47-like protein [Paraburkholderia atlantica]MBB5421668.1 hypothetical protein [Paraburkholderia atlantica]